MNKEVKEEKIEISKILQERIKVVDNKKMLDGKFYIQSDDESDEDMSEEDKNDGEEEEDYDEY